MSEPQAPMQPALEDVIDALSSPTEAPDREVAADNSESMDAVLDRLLGNDEPEPRSGFSTPEPRSAPEPDPEMGKALKALRRDGVPQDVIDAAMSSPDKVRDWGLKAAKRQADVDSFGSKMSNQQKQDAEAPKASAASEDKEADADPLSEFGNIFGEEAAKPLGALTERIKADFDARIKALEVRHSTQLAYQSIASEYGADSPSYDEIADEAARIGSSNAGKFDSYNALVREAFRQKVGEPKARRADLREIGRPTIGRPTPRPVKQVDRDDAVLDVLLAGGTRADALKAASR